VSGIIRAGQIKPHTHTYYYINIYYWVCLCFKDMTRSDFLYFKIMQ